MNHNIDKPASADGRCEFAAAANGWVGSSLSPTRSKASGWLKTALAAVGLFSGSAASAAVVWHNVDTSQFATLDLNTPTPVNFIGTGDLTMTRLSLIGSPIVLSTWNGTFSTPVGGQNNPDWVLGTRSYFDVECPVAGTAQSTVAYEFLYAGGLATDTQLVFVDFDWSEQVTIKAYDSANNLIPFADTAILLSPGADATPRYQDVEWVATGGATGVFRNTFDDSESNVTASISSSTSIHRLVYEFDFSQVDAAGATIRFQLAAVPEPSTALLGVTGAVLLLRRRRQA